MQTEPKKLYRSRTDRMIGGVCSGIARYFNIDATVVRLLFVLLAFISSGFPMLVAYLVLLLVVPEELQTSMPPAEARPAETPPIDVQSAEVPPAPGAQVVDEPPSPGI